MSQEVPGPFPEKLVRKATGVVYRAITQGHLGLLDRLTEQNRAAMTALGREKALFASNNERAPQEILLDDAVRPLFPDGFFENPTAWIEAQPRLISPEQQTGEKGYAGSIRNIYLDTYDADIERVKRIELHGLDGKTVTLVSKRLNPKFDDWHEVEAARRAYEVGIPTPRVLGEISDRGNHYALFEYIPSIDYAHIRKSFGLDGSYSSLASMQSAGKRFFTGEKKQQFSTLLRRAKEWDRYGAFEWRLRKESSETVKFSFSALEEGAKSPEEFLQHLSRRIAAIIPAGPAIDAYISATQFATKDAFVMQMAIWTIQQYAITSRYNAGTSPLFSEIMKGTVPKSETQSQRSDAAVSAAHSILRAAPKLTFRKSRDELEQACEATQDFIRNEIFGKDGIASIERQIRDIQGRCMEVSLPPYDQTRIMGKNIAIAWDAATDRPRHRADGSIELYVLDWER